MRNTRGVPQPFTPRPYSLKSIFQTCTTIGRWHALRTHALEQYDWNQSRSLRRSVQFGKPTPWWPYALTQFLDQLVSPQATILEFGSGASTLWWGERGNPVTAIENNAEWGTWVAKEAERHSYNVELHLVDDFQKPLPLKLSQTKYELISIDNDGDRGHSIAEGLQYLEQGGWLVLDNSDRLEYHTDIAFLEHHGFSRLDFHGLGPTNAYAWTSTIFDASGFIVPRGRSLNQRNAKY